MSKVNGVVKAVAKSGKGLMIDNMWYNTGQPVLRPELRGKTVTFEIDGRNFIQGTVDVDESAPVAKSPSPKKFVDNSVGMGVGMAVNNACQFAIADGRGYDEDFVNETAIKIYQLAEKLKEQASSGGFEVASKVAAAIDADEENPFV